MSSNQGEELRKVQVTGGSTFIVSLPKPWVEQMGLQKGSIIRIKQRDDLTLCLSPEGADKNESQRRAIINPRPDDTPESIVRRVVSAYLMGYNIIQLRNNQQRLDSSQRFNVKDFTRKKLVGTEILSDLPKDLTLQVLLSYAELSVKDALRRMSVIAASMHRDAIIALGTEEVSLAKEIVAMDDEVDRFNLYIIRLLKVAVVDGHILKESGLKSPRECLGYRLITKSVERMADHAVNIAHNRLELTLSVIDKTLLDELKKLSEFALDIFESAMASVFNESYAEADRILDMAQDTRKMEAEILHTIVKHAPPEEVPALRLIVESILRTAEYGADIAETVLNMMVIDAVKEA
ncbi:AbrB/MazE/SpoVT family DNA-binding domain-containing protein [Candidatus Bathyarchaeota archaeon]|nr:AbrB/MazE/SpoVT family DNA-binding domain-containing protein [Candidatus Bathyarchaeota archaeon]